MYIFFFQAEDGIRDLVRSRGLGDVYKRQLQHDDAGHEHGQADHAPQDAALAGAHQHDDEITHALKQPLVAMTPASPTNPKVLRSHLAVVRKRGWDLAVDDVIIGLTALARDEGLDTAISRADQAMYRAKRSGGNSWVLAET